MRSRNWRFPMKGISADCWRFLENSGKKIFHEKIPIPRMQIKYSSTMAACNLTMLAKSEKRIRNFFMRPTEILFINIYFYFYFFTLMFLTNSFIVNYCKLRHESRPRFYILCVRYSYWKPCVGATMNNNIIFNEVNLQDTLTKILQALLPNNPNKSVEVNYNKYLHQSPS